MEQAHDQECNCCLMLQLCGELSNSAALVYLSRERPTSASVLMVVCRNNLHLAAELLPAEGLMVGSLFASQGPVHVGCTRRMISQNRSQCSSVSIMLSTDILIVFPKQCLVP